MINQADHLRHELQREESEPLWNTDQARDSEHSIFRWGALFLRTVRAIGVIVELMSRILEGLPRIAA